MGRLLIRNGTIVSDGRSFTGTILIENDVITSITESSPQIAGNVREIDASGKYVLPGIIDDQVHFRDPGLTHKGDLFTESRAAVAGGVTSFMEMPNTNPQTITVEALKNKLKDASEKSVANYSFYFGATNDNIDEILKVDPALICGVKVFMGASTGNMLVDNEESLRQIFSRVKIPVACHCEDEPTIIKNTEHYKKLFSGDVPFSAHPLIRSREACLKSSGLAVKLAREYGTRLHILHLSTADEMVFFADGELKDKKITSEVCIHHLFFDDRDYDSKGAFIKWNPAIKTPHDREALKKALTDGRIDIIATDHAPHTKEEKGNSYFSCPSGGPMVQHSLVAMLELYHDGLLSLEKIVTLMCHNPSILFSIKERGFIREGYKADLAIVDLDDPWTVSPENILYKCGWSPFEGKTFNSRVNYTIINGNVAYENGKVDNNHRGEKLEFNR